CPSFPYTTLFRSCNVNALAKLSTACRNVSPVPSNMPRLMATDTEIRHAGCAFSFLWTNIWEWWEWGRAECRLVIGCQQLKTMADCCWLNMASLIRLLVYWVSPLHWHRRHLHALELLLPVSITTMDFVIRREHL